MFNTATLDLFEQRASVVDLSFHKAFLKVMTAVHCSWGALGLQDIQKVLVSYCRSPYAFRPISNVNVNIFPLCVLLVSTGVSLTFFWHFKEIFQGKNDAHDNIILLIYYTKTIAVYIYIVFFVISSSNFDITPTRCLLYIKPLQPQSFIHVETGKPQHSVIEK